MKHYFQLQLTLMNRRFKDLGFKPLFAYILLGIAFYVFSFFLFQRTEYAVYFYLFISLTSTAKLSEIKRYEFLKTSFKNSRLRQIRLIENGITSVPFLMFLVYKQLFLFALLLLVLSSLLALANFKTTINWTIPTPFYKKPFEFLVGFRNTFYLFLLAYSLAGISIYVNNFNLGAFSIIFVFVLMMGFYTLPENEIFVWNFNVTARDFLFTKLKIAWVYASFIVVPLSIILTIFFPQNLTYILLAILVGYGFLSCMLLAKYAVFPNEINLTQFFFFGISVLFPPLLLLLIPHYFLQSAKRLKAYLK